jgi:hypothetical protein
MFGFFIDTIFVFFGKAISCFFSALRQFKFVKPTRQPGGKQTSYMYKKKQSYFCMLCGRENNKNLINSFINDRNTQQRV